MTIKMRIELNSMLSYRTIFEKISYPQMLFIFIASLSIIGFSIFAKTANSETSRQCIEFLKRQYDIQHHAISHCDDYAKLQFDIMNDPLVLPSRHPHLFNDSYMSVKYFFSRISLRRIAPDLSTIAPIMQVLAMNSITMTYLEENKNSIREMIYQTYFIKQLSKFLDRDDIIIGAQFDTLFAKIIKGEYSAYSEPIVAEPFVNCFIYYDIPSWPMATILDKMQETKCLLPNGESQ